MAELKTKKTNASVKDFLDSIEDDQVREDSFKIAEMMESHPVHRDIDGDLL